MSVYFDNQEASSTKTPKTYQNFAYDNETNGGCLNKLDEMSKLISSIQNDIEELGLKYTTLQGKYDKFTRFNETMNTNKTALRNAIDAIKKAFDDIVKNLGTQVDALQKSDSKLITDLEAINKMISNGSTQDKALQDTRTKNDSTPSVTNSDIDKAVDDVINGKYGTGDERKAALKKAGFDPDEVQKRVNEKLTGTSPSSTPSNGGGSSSGGSSTDRPETPKETQPDAGYNPATGGKDTFTGRGPNGKETYYNLDMDNIVRQSQPGGWIYNDAKAHGNEGNLSDNYWVREDGCKMMGDYIMVAANLDVHPRGSIVQTSMGPGIVVDTGGFAATNPNQLDIATTW